MIKTACIGDLCHVCRARKKETPDEQNRRKGSKQKEAAFSGSLFKSNTRTNV
jgi:hypothetical protein